MKKFILIISIIGIGLISRAQQIINGTIVHDGLQRSYILYIPDSYTGESAPLVLNLHGYTSSGLEQMFYGDFRSIADTAGFILVHPNGTDDPSGTPYWNAEFGGEVDDIGFLESLIDSLALEYSIDMEKVYSTGMSNGGFMSYTLACNINNRIAAVASVTGTMLTMQLGSCAPEHPTPIMEIHGTSDFVVPYDGNAVWASTPQVVEYWVNYNQCIESPVITDIPDTDPDDGCTAQRYDYQNGINGSSVAHYKIDGGGHTWPGSAINTGNGNTNQDFNASAAIWAFFRQYDLNGIVTSIDETASDPVVTLFPNPAGNYIQIKTNQSAHYKVVIYDVIGRDVLNRVFHGNECTVSVKSLVKDIYVIRIENTDSHKSINRKIVLR